MPSPRGVGSGIARICAILVGVWFAVLLVLDAIYGGRIADRVGERLAESLQGTATIDGSDLALVRGHLDLSDLRVVRDDLVGHLSLKVDNVRCELAPLGIGVVDHGCRTLAIRGTRLEVSTASLFQLKAPKRAPIHTERVIIDDAELAFSPSAFVPGLGRVTIHIDHAESGETTFYTPLAWLITMESLEAHLDLPAGITVRLRYAAGVMSASGTLFGSEPVAMPLPLHLPTAIDAKTQIQQLVEIGKSVAEDLVAKRAEDWIKSKLP